MNHPAYPAYKESGVSWLGTVPEHWEVKRLKMFAHLNEEKVEADSENPLPYIGLENIESGTGRLHSIDLDVVPSGIANKFSETDTLFGKLRPYLSKACNPDFKGLCSTELLVLESKEFDRRAILYWLLADGFIQLVDSSTYGSKMPRVNWDFIGNCRLPVPPLSEQTAIADFLDRETGRIDTLIEKKRRLIGLLREKRSALISRTVTRGLPAEAAREFGLEPHTCFKDSGIAWLGEVPEGWKVVTLKWIIRTKSGDGILSSDVLSEKSEDARIPVIGGNGVMGYCAKANIVLPVLVIGRVGALCGNTHEVYESAWVTDNALIITFLQNDYHLRYLAAVLRTRKLNDIADKTAQPLITGTRVRAEFVPVPPIVEQTAIATYLDRETAKIDKLINKVEQAIERLQEYRTALITAAVTGKIDVRYAAENAGQFGLTAEEEEVYG